MQSIFSIVVLLLILVVILLHNTTIENINAICFTAGIGENSFFARKGICDLLKDALGIELDEDANVNGQGDRLISTPNSKVKVFVIPTNEELVIARDTKRLLNL